MKALVLKFVEQELPHRYKQVQDLFRRRCAYTRLKDMLQNEGVLGRWYTFENQCTDKALREWCAENGIELLTGTVASSGLRMSMDADIKQEFTAIRAEIQTSQMALRQEIREEAIATRRHFDVVAENLRDGIRIIAEGLIALDAKVETMRD